MSRWLFALALAVLVGVGSLYVVTNHFTVLTAEAARRQAVMRSPRPVPDVAIRTASGQQHFLRDDLRQDGRVAIVNFFYTRCVSLCLAQGSLTERLQQAIRAEGLAQQVRLISISFDARDSTDDLARYAQRMGAIPGVWQFMGLVRSAQQQTLLQLFGITVVPAPLGEFEHNAAFHVVTPGGRLARVFDLDDPGLALKAAVDLWRHENGRGGSVQPLVSHPATGAAP